MEAYRAIPGVNWSTLSMMDRSPLHYRHLLDNPRSDSDAFRVGRCVHLAVLQPELLEESIAVWEGGDKRTKAVKEAWGEFQVSSVGKEILSAHERDLVAGMALAVHNHPVAHDLLSGICRTEEPVTWCDGLTDIECKCRPDLIRVEASQLVELKTTRAGGIHEFARLAATYRYHGQIAFYQDGTGCSGDPMIIAVENLPPHDVVVYNASAMIDPGRALYRHCLDRLVECQERNEWPGVASDVVDLALPDWAYKYVEGGAPGDLDWSGVEVHDGNA